MLTLDLPIGDHGIDYTQEDFTRSGQRYDLIFQLAGTVSPSDCRRALTANGTLVLSSGEGRFAGIDRAVRAFATSPFVRQRLRLLATKETNEDPVTLAAPIDAGKLTPVIDGAYRLSEVPEAIRYLEAGHARGRSSSPCEARTTARARRLGPGTVWHRTVATLGRMYACPQPNPSVDGQG